MSAKDSEKLRLRLEPVEGNQQTDTSKEEENYGADRRESGVFLSPQVSQSPDSQVQEEGAAMGLMLPPSTAHRSHSSGYSTGLSTSSVSSTFLSDVEQTKSGSTAQTTRGPPTGMFRLESAEFEEFHDCQEGVLLETGPDSGTHSQPVGADTDDTTDNIDSDDEYDQLELSGLSTDTVVEAATYLSLSQPMAIPDSTHELHEAHVAAMRRMEATPPRGYLKQESSGCMTTVSPVIASILTQRRQVCKTTGDILANGFRVTSGFIHASTSTAEIHRTKTYASGFGVESEETDEAREPSLSHRERSQSAPLIGCSAIVQKKCGDELRKISDEFFSEFPRKVRQDKGRQIRSQSQACIHPMALSSSTNRGQHLSSSYPGTARGFHSSWWWQAIIQNYRPPISPCDINDEQLAGDR